MRPADVSATSVQATMLQSPSSSCPKAPNVEWGNSVQTLLLEAAAAVRLGQPLRSRALFDKVDELLGRLDSKVAAEVAESIPLLARTDIALGDFELAAERLSLGFSLASRMRATSRTPLNLLLQATRVYSHAAQGDLRAAASHCEPLLSIRSAAPEVIKSQTIFLLECCNVLRRLGQYTLQFRMLEFVDELQSQLTSEESAEVRLRVLFSRVSSLAHQAGCSLRARGPLGWDMGDRTQASQRLRQNIALLEDEVRLAEAVGDQGHAATGRQLLEAYPSQAPMSPAKALSLMTKRIDFYRQRGYRSEGVEHHLDLAALQVAAGEFARAKSTLEHISEPWASTQTYSDWSETWHWLWFQCLQHEGRLEQALQVYGRYAQLVCERQQIGAAFVLKVLSSFGQVGSGDSVSAGVTSRKGWSRPAAPSWSSANGATFERRLKEICSEAKTVSEVAAAVGVSPRRLQQLLKLHNLPTPAQYLRAVRTGQVRAIG